MILFELDPAGNLALNKRLSQQLRADINAAADRGEATADMYADRFPEWVLLQQPSRCRRTMEELQLMARDGYRHRLTTLQQYVLYHYAMEWANDLEDDLAVGVPAAEFEASEAAQDYWVGVCELFDLALLQVDVLANAVLAGEALPFPVQVTDYLDLMPLHVRQEVLTVLARKTDTP